LLDAERGKRQHTARLTRALSSLQRGLALHQQSLSYYQLRPEEEALLHAVMRRNENELESTNPFELAHCAAHAGAASSSRGSTAAAGASASACASPPVQQQGAPLSDHHQLHSASPAPPVTPPASVDGACDGADVGAAHQQQQIRSRLAEIDARLREFGALHVWDDMGSLADFRGVFDRRSTPVATGVAATTGDQLKKCRSTLSCGASADVLAGGGSPHRNLQSVPPPSPSPGAGGGCCSGAMSPLQLEKTASSRSLSTVSTRQPRRTSSGRGGSALPRSSDSAVVGSFPDAAAVVSGGKIDYLIVAREKRELENRFV